MRVGIEFSEEWKCKSQETGIPLPDLLYGFVVEDFFLRLKKTSFCEALLLQNEQALGKEAYKRKVKECLNFFYMKKLDIAFVTALLEELFSQKNEITWECHKEESEKNYLLHLQAEYLEMKVPVTIKIEELSQAPKEVKNISMACLLKEGENVSCLCYSKESILSRDIFEMMKNLELISDMSVYDNINDIIKSQTISGRYIKETLQDYIDREPKVLNIKRLEQINSYKDYVYMKKRWQQYQKRSQRSSEEWSVVIERIVKFVGPVWSALCKNEIFFDDWMPELERFLG